ncbi:hypothetical protein BaRGS_00033979 [Batillaria attramentaria]|uniref:Uncharacterized protein n=1 Tax=Batillaria attramentaria TaxID=370345 RepID=A0ABD0JJ70_9CAEN
MLHNWFAINLSPLSASLSFSCVKSRPAYRQLSCLLIRCRFSPMQPPNTIKSTAVGGKGGGVVGGGGGEEVGGVDRRRSGRAVTALINPRAFSQRDKANRTQHTHTLSASSDPRAQSAQPRANRRWLLRYRKCTA